MIGRARVPREVSRGLAGAEYFGCVSGIIARKLGDDLVPAAQPASLALVY